jgi:hypothetical protein
MPNWQFRSSACNVGCYPALAYEPFQQRFHGNTLAPSFIGKAGFGFMRNVDAHGLCSYFQVTAAADFTPLPYATPLRHVSGFVTA